MRKRILFMVLAMFFLCNQGVYANQDINIEDNKAVISIQKQPTQENEQKQEVKNNWFCIVVQLNGKIKDTDTTIQPDKQ